MTSRLDFPIDLSTLGAEPLTFVEAIATECRYQAPRMFDALGWALERERKRRDAGLTEPVWFTLGDAVPRRRLARYVADVPRAS
jgi:hypothetical protein